MAGLELDEWQELVLAGALGERDDGKWSAFEVALVAPRQNGKNSVLEARQLTGLFLLGERLLIHSAHQFDTSLEAFRRLLFLIEDTPDFDARVKRVSRAHGEEGIELKGGQRIRFRTRTKGGGRGFTSDCLMLDEAMILPEAMIGALLPTLSARPNPQVWYTGSAVDQLVHVDGIVLSRLRERAVGGADASLAYFEWSANGDNPASIEDDYAADSEAWAEANPALGIRINEEHIEREHRSMPAREFAVERLGIGDWPDPDGDATVVDMALWNQLGDPESKIAGSVAFAVDVSPDRSSASIAAAGKRMDGLPHLEVIDQRRGTGWIVERLAELVDKWTPVGVVIDGAGPAASLIPGLTEAKVDFTLASAKEHSQACGLFYDAVSDSKVRHLGTSELRSALRGATKRPLGDAWAWNRKNSAVDISPLVACTLALWGVTTMQPPILEPMIRVT